jgi:tetratricopeptide (TPR) repeat protein
MARYDRIALVPAPPREQAFPAWSVLKDLEGQERAEELARRARLRFLALRPVRRLLRQRGDALPVSSYERQIEGVREELGHLSARDPERAQLADFLHRIEQQAPLAVVAATLDMGEVAEEAGHFAAADEYYRTALELAAQQGLLPERVIGLRLLGRIARKAGQWEVADARFREAQALALQLGDRRQWARCAEALGVVWRYAGEPERASHVLEEALAQGRSWQDGFVLAVASAALSLHMLALGRPDAAVEHGWTALRLLERGERNALLLNLGLAFRHLGLYPAAERCYQLAAREAAAAGCRVRAQALHALVAAEAGATDAFRERRQRLLEAAPAPVSEPDLAADLHLELGRGCLLAGLLADARAHAREVLALRRWERLPEFELRANELLHLADEVAAGHVAAARPTLEPAPRSREVAGELEAMGRMALAR